MRSVLCILALLAGLCLAGESCCAKKRAQLAKLQYVPDESEQPPDFDAEGNPRLIQDPDDEDMQIENPAFSWSPRLIPNPNYEPPPTFRDELFSEVSKALPWIILGVIITAILEAAALPMNALSGLLHRAGPLGGAVIGLATPLCSCGALPVAAGFASTGVPLGAVVAFLTASQSAGLDSAAITWGMLGPTATVCRLGGAAVLATVAGFAVGAHRDASRGAIPAEKASRRKGAAAECGKAGESFAFHRALGRASVSSFAEAFPPVLFGLVLSTSATHYLPALATPYFGLKTNSSSSSRAPVGDSLVVRMGVLAAAMPLQLCEHSSVALAAGVQKAGGGAGLAFALLLAAPAVNLPSLLLLTSAQPRSGPRSGPRVSRFVALRVSLALMTGALLLSYAVDAAGIDLLVAQEAEAGGAGSMAELPAPLVLASPWMAGLLGIAALVRAKARRVRPAPPAPLGEARRRHAREDVLDSSDSCCIPCDAPHRDGKKGR